ncbi:GatB/YqeY domain-containing protein [Alloalcanivorax mobilis]|uniref:GatB/YqeY domain-containing protein n=1 Tax=Alloalcanivorax mobilis TaxID=2019569 RepID=UPI000B5B3C8B|nr:GatB/YqeY domain-containing protein [Alloalcanivorax mobilis]ASK32991.1 glutamyl-tRNA amidotransferase [Alcanivorax sp. N3-2A]ASK36809.1 glutamyl-tRNA amidotransferase [Alcanivorax sp. N3-2A]|tara:strand:- start:13730 stop:14179 length:450 start_codon:yes stop_codon:yes gene_type:complete
MSTLKAQLTDAMKDAMRAKDKVRLGVIRMTLSAIKQIEVDERVEVDDERALAVLDKLIKQRKDSATQYRDAGRDDLADVEEAEIVVLQAFLPAPLSDAEIDALIDEAIAETGASGMQDMGKIMGVLKPRLQGRADMGAASGKVKARLNA